MIPIKHIDENEFLDLVSYRKIAQGGEAIICEGDSYESVYKIFSSMYKPTSMSDNKVSKIKELYDLQLKNSTQPLSLVSINDIIIGYEMTSDIGLETVSPMQLSKSELKYFLHTTKIILEYFKEHNIIYGDVAMRNILFNRDTGDIQFCDMDNIMLGDYPMDKFPSSLLTYKYARGIDDGVNPYMHNLLTLDSLGLDSYWVSKQEIKKHFRKPAKDIIASMACAKNFTNEYIVKYLKKI